MDSLINDEGSSVKWEAALHLTLDGFASSAASSNTSFISIVLCTPQFVQTPSTTRWGYEGCTRRIDSDIYFDE